VARATSAAGSSTPIRQVQPTQDQLLPDPEMRAKLSTHADEGLAIALNAIGQAARVVLKRRC
jgi:hypothetical protein